MKLREIIPEDIKRRDFFAGLSAAIAGVKAKAQSSDTDEVTANVVKTFIEKYNELITLFKQCNIDAKSKKGLPHSCEYALYAWEKLENLRNMAINDDNMLSALKKSKEFQTVFKSFTIELNIAKKNSEKMR